jgi:hypothetical protein
MDLRLQQQNNHGHVSIAMDREAHPGKDHNNYDYKEKESNNMTSGTVQVAGYLISIGFFTHSLFLLFFLLYS